MDSGVGVIPVGKGSGPTPTSEALLAGSVNGSEVGHRSTLIFIVAVSKHQSVDDKRLSDTSNDIPIVCAPDAPVTNAATGNEGTNDSNEDERDLVLFLLDVAVGNAAIVANGKLVKGQVEPGRGDVPVASGLGAANEVCIGADSILHRLSKLSIPASTFAQSLLKLNALIDL